VATCDERTPPAGLQGHLELWPLVPVILEKGIPQTRVGRLQPEASLMVAVGTLIYCPCSLNCLPM
jgi:hypothetical protein